MDYLESQEQREMRDKVTKLFAMTHMDDPLWERVSAAFDWQDVWPEIDAECRLTGEVVEPIDQHYSHYPSWDAVIHRDVALEGGWVIDHEQGYAYPKGAK
jgi:hypothetical protein